MHKKKNRAANRRPSPVSLSDYPKVTFFGVCPTVKLSPNDRRHPFRNDLSPKIYLLRPVSQTFQLWSKSAASSRPLGVFERLAQKYLTFCLYCFDLIFVPFLNRLSKWAFPDKNESKERKIFKKSSQRQQCAGSRESF